MSLASTFSATESQIPAPHENRHPTVTLSHLREDGSMMERRLNLKFTQDMAILERTALWAAHNGIEIRIRPSL